MQGLSLYCRRCIDLRTVKLKDIEHISRTHTYHVYAYIYIYIYIYGTPAPPPPPEKENKETEKLAPREFDSIYNIFW